MRSSLLVIFVALVAYKVQALPIARIMPGSWSQIPGGLKIITKGKAGVFGVNGADNIYQLNEDGNSWTQINGRLRQISSGSEVWGVNGDDLIYRYLGNNQWQQMPGRLTNVAVSDKGHVWGVNRAGLIYRWLGNSWENIQGRAIQVSVGPSGVWVVNAANNIYYRVGTRGDGNVAGTRWLNIPGKLRWIASGMNIVVGTNANNAIYYRNVINNANPSGTTWTSIPGRLNTIDIWDDEIVGCNAGDNIYRRVYAPVLGQPVLAGLRRAPLSNLSPGDRITITGIFREGAARWGFNIVDDAGNYLFRTAFRLRTDPAGNGPITILNSRLDGAWQGELQAPWPGPVDQKPFTIDVVVKADKYIEYFNGEIMRGVNFPFRQPIAGATAIQMWGGGALGNNGAPILWNTIEVSRDEDNCWEHSNYAGDDIRMQPNVATREDCLAACKAQEGCLSITYVPANQNCWLKRTLYGASRGAGGLREDLWSRSLDCQQTCPLGYVLNTGDIPGWGTDIGSRIEVESREECADRCDEIAECKSFEHSNTENLCNLNLDAEPTQIAYNDYAFCTKQGGELGEVVEEEEEPENILTSDLVVSQNSVGWNGQPQRGIDGNTNGQWNGGSCTHSAGAANNWWKVDLPELYAIDKVTIWNRLDCCSDRVSTVKVYVGEEYCGQVNYVAGEQSFDVECNGAVGGYIYITNGENYLTLCEVEAFGQPAGDDAVALINVAKDKPTFQSSVGWGGIASRAVDGRTSGIWNHATCTHSAGTGDNVWRVDLLDEYEINSVIIHNRVDCCQPRINTAQVFVGDELCGAVEFEDGRNAYKIDCGGRSGDTVEIRRSGDYLTLCEVEVLAAPVEDTLINIAGDGTATQSDVGWNGVPERAIDGNTNPQWGGGSCSHTGSPAGGWWNLHFEDPVNVDQVIIYNRADCCSERINGVTVFADDLLCGTIEYHDGQPSYSVECREDDGGPVSAYNVRIMARNNEYLTLCEVKVMSDPTADIGEGAINLAYNKPTSQSSTGWGGVPARAVDGRESGLWGHGTCTHTNGAGWWMVDLLDDYIVEKIWIKNRDDCCSERINGVQVFVGDILCGTITYEASKKAYEVLCNEGNGIIGDRVKIVNPTTYLTLCEVKVWGPSEPVIADMLEVDEVEGDRSAAADDATSTAACPVGEVVVDCELSEGVIGAGADGLLVSEAMNQCVAWNGWGGSGVRALARCAPNQQVPDPCNGPALLKYKRVYSRGTDPRAECPAGYEPLVCTAHSWWIEQVRDKGIPENGVIEGECAIAGCSDAHWCDVSLVCAIPDDTSSYEAALCPGCDGYTCPDGQICEMEDGEQQCVVRQTGCDIDRCGDHGECEAVGSEDYTCICEEHYEFDERAGTCMPSHSHYRTQYGEKAVGDDALSIASCNAGEKVMRCHTFGAPSAADGVTIVTNGDVVRCEARASSARSFPIMAVAYCGDDNRMTDPCTQDEIHSIEYRYSSSLSPEVSCPGGYVMESCIFHSPWTQSLTAENRARINSIGAVDINDDGSCTMENCLSNPAGHQWCKLTAVCKKLTGSEYLRAACPTCDDVRCPDEQECNMVNDLPACLPRIPGGCEEDRCGEGVCVEDGPNYTCQCNEGYSFDGETCADVDECAEEPCGNGECTNTPGSYSCECDDGYELSHGSCEDINECLDNPCDDTERCSNIEGSFICDCLDTFVQNGDGDCVCLDGYQNQDGACVDIDECAADENPCSGENEVCVNNVGGYTCDCAEEAERNRDGVCEVFAPFECDVRAKKPRVKGFRGMNVNVKLAGEKKKVFKKYAEIEWTKNGVAWNPRNDGKEKFNGFTIRNFDADDEGMYIGTIYIDIDGVHSRCEVEVEIILVEGSVSLRVENEESLMEPQRTGRELKVKCDLDLDNVKLDDPKNPDNVNWYRVTDDGDELLDDDDNFAIERARGTYNLVFKNPQVDDSGSYRCEFDQAGFEASSEVAIQFVD